jgi:hypothetical protein
MLFRNMSVNIAYNLIAYNSADNFYQCGASTSPRHTSGILTIFTHCPSNHLFNFFREDVYEREMMSIEGLYNVHRHQMSSNSETSPMQADPPVSDREVGWCLEPEGNGVKPGGGNGGGPGPPSGERDKQLTASRGGGNSLMEQEEDGKKGQT